MSQFHANAGNTGLMHMIIFCGSIERLRTVRDQLLSASLEDFCHGSFATDQCAGILCKRGFLGWFGTHRLRHSFATRLYARGATTKEIADLLGHRLVATTDRYTQTRDLRALAQPWANLALESKLMLVRQYLGYRRKLGYRMSSAELLLDFGRFADREAPGEPLTTALAVQWASAVPSIRRATRAGRLGMVRGFARYCASLDERTQIPDPYLLGPTFQRSRPHLFTPAETKLIIQRARRLGTSRSPLHPLTYETLIGLLASTGMRPGEALRLHWQDLNVDQRTLRIGPCKFSPERVIVLHPTTVRALVRYSKVKDGRTARPANCCQSQVARARGVAAFGLQVIKESEHGLRVQHFEP